VSAEAEPDRMIDVAARSAAADDRSEPCRSAIEERKDLVLMPTILTGRA
jgi:hypothetical protein